MLLLLNLISLTFLFIKKTFFTQHLYHAFAQLFSFSLFSVFVVLQAYYEGIYMIYGPFPAIL